MSEELEKTAKRLLIIDDSDGIRDFLERLAKNAGYSCDKAPDGAKGLELFEPGKYDKVFLDLRMPGMSGEQVMYKILEQDKNIEIIIYSSTPEDLKKVPERVSLLVKGTGNAEIQKHL